MHTKSFRIGARRNERGEEKFGWGRGAIINTKCISWKPNREFSIYLIVNFRIVPTLPSGKDI
jgi:hypothetical protein